MDAQDTEQSPTPNTAEKTGTAMATSVEDNNKKSDPELEEQQEMPPPPPKQMTEKDSTTEINDADNNKDGNGVKDEQKMPPPPPMAVQKDITKESEKDEGQMLPPPPKKSTPQETVDKTENDKAARSVKNSGSKYEPPSWSGIRKGISYCVEIMKTGTLLEKRDVSAKEFYTFGRQPTADFVVEHPSSSRFHCVIQYDGGTGEAFLIDLESTHGTFLNKRKLKPNVHVPLRVGDMFRLGQSTRLYVFGGPEELRPQEGLNKNEQLLMLKLKAAEKQREKDRQIAAAQMQSALSGGVSWGFGEDAIEEVNEDGEVNWRTYAAKHKLTDKQQKLADKIRSRELKINHLNKESERIEAKGRGGEGLTPGQATVLARNEQTTEKLNDEMEDLEEMLQESVQESISAKSDKVKKKSKRKKRTWDSDDEDDVMDDDDDVMDDDDDDEFYDRTRGKKVKKPKEGRKALSAKNLHLQRLDLQQKKEQLKKKLVEEATQGSQEEGAKQDGDVLDAFMSAIETQIEKAKVGTFEAELQEVEDQLKEVERLLKIADPDGFYNPQNVKQRENAMVTAKKLASQVASKFEPQEKTTSMPAPPQKPPPTSTPPKAPNQPHSMPIEHAQEPQEAPTVNPVHTNTDASHVPIVSEDREKHKPVSGSQPRPLKAERVQMNKAERQVLDDLMVLSSAKQQVQVVDEDDGECSDWQHPEGQTGDGRTHLNDKFGY